MSDIYKIGVHLAMTSNASGVLASLSKTFLRTEGSIEHLERGMRGISRGAIAAVGALAAIGGVAVLAGFKSVTDHAKELTKELTLLKNLGLSQGVINGMQGAARDATRSVAGSTESQNLKFQREAYSVFGAKNATAIMPYLSKFAQLSGDVNGGDYKKGEDDVIKLIRSGDLMGKFINEKTGLADPEKVKGFMDLVGRMVTAGGGMFDASTMLALAQQGGPALSNMSDDGLMSMFMAAQDMGGFRAGTAASSLKQQFTGGTMTKAVAMEAHRLGLIGSYRMEGQKVVLGKDQTKFQGLLNTDLLGAGTELEKILEKNGYKSKESQINELYKVLSRQTSQRLIADIIRNLTNKTAERGRLEGVQPLDQQLKNFNDQDIGTNEHNLQASWENLMQAIAGPNAKNYISVLDWLTQKINWFTEVVRKADPDRVAAIGTAIGVIGVALIGAGGVAILAALGPAGWMVIGIGALAAACIAFKKPLDEAVKSWDKIADSIKASLTGVADAIGTEIKSWPARLADAIMGFGRSIIEMIKNVLSSLNPFSRTAYTGDGVGGGGFMNASYGGGGGGRTWGGGMMPVGSGTGIGHSASQADRAAFTRAYAASIGIDPSTALRVSQSEGFYKYSGDHGMSFGEWQLYTGGGLGNKAMAAGINIRDPSTWKQQTKFALDWARTHGWADWHGAAKVGIGNHQGIGVQPRRQSFVMPPPSQQKPTVIHTHVHVDGKVMAKVVTKHQSQMAAMPNAIGTHDSFGSYFPPGGTQVPT